MAGGQHAAPLTMMSEHRKDMFFVAARYWGWLQPTSVFSAFLVLVC